MVNMKYYKIVYGFKDELNYFPITSEELHKAYVLAMEGGKTIFKAGFFQNRGNDILRIIPDWHAEKGWNKGYQMGALDFEDISPLEEGYNQTLQQGRLLAEYIVRDERRDLLNLPMSEGLKEMKQLASHENRSFSDETKKLAEKFKI